MKSRPEVRDAGAERRESLGWDQRKKRASAIHDDILHVCSLLLSRVGIKRLGWRSSGSAPISAARCTSEILAAETAPRDERAAGCSRERRLQRRPSSRHLCASAWSHTIN